MNVASRTTTVAALRAVLSAVFDPSAVIVSLMRLREAGLLPAGRKGRSGSARITPRQAALALLTVSLDRRNATEAAGLAQQVAAYRVRAVFPDTGGGASFRQDVPLGPRFDDWLGAELERVAADPAIRLASLQIEPPIGVFTLDPALLADPPPRLRLVRTDLAFEPDEPPEVRALPLPAVRRATLVHGDLLHAIGTLFERREPVRGGVLAALFDPSPEADADGAETPLDAIDAVAGTPVPPRASAASLGRP
jgi:hypothetical protein